MVDFDVNVKLQAGNAQSQLRQMERGLQSVETQAQKATGGFSLMGSAVTGAMTALSNTAISAATTALNKLAQAAIGSVQVFAGFEKSMNNVAALSGATGREFDSLQKKARELGASTRFSASEVADAMGFLAMAGFETNQILDSTGTILDLAAAGNLDLARAADIASNTMGQFAISAEDSERVTNVLAATASSANTNVEQLAEAMKYLGPTAQSLGISLEETAAIVGTLGDSAIQGGLAGRALGSALVRLTNPTNEMQAAINELGLSISKANGEFVTFEDFLRQIEEATADYTPTQKAATLSALLGADAYQEISVLLLKGSEAYAQYTEEITGTNRAQEIAEIQGRGLTGRWKELLSATEALRIEFGKELSPVVTDLVGFLGNLAREFVSSGNAEDFAKQMAEQLKDALDNVKASFEGVDFPKLADDLAKTTGNLIKLAEGVMAVVKAIELFNRYTFQPSPLPDGFYNENNQIDIRGVINQTNPIGPNKWSLDQTNYDIQRAYGVGSDMFDTSLYTNPVPEPVPQPDPPTQGQIRAASELSSAANSIKKASQMLGYYIEGNTGPTSTGEHFDIKRVDRGYFDRAMLDQYVRVNGRPLSSGVTVPGGQFGASRDYGSHAGWDYAFGAGEHRLELTNGAAWTGLKSGTANGDLATFRTPNGDEFQILHGKFIKTGEGATGLDLAEYRTSLESQKPFLTNPMAVSLGDPLNLAGLMKEAQKQVALEDFDEANRGLLEQIELIERKLELADMDATQREHILEIEALERESRAQLAEREEQLNELVKEGAFNDDEKAQQLAELITLLERYKLAVMDTQEAEIQARDDAIAYQQALEGGAIYAERLAEKQAQAREYVALLTDEFTKLSVSVISGAASMEEALGKLFNSILSYLANQAFQGLFSQLFSGLFGLGGGPDIAAPIGPDPFNLLPKDLLPNANGNVLRGGFQAFANGGIVTRPTLGLIGEGSMNEAVVPLPDGRRIPVQMQGGGGTNITVNVNNPSSGEDGRRLGRQISEAIRAELVNQRRTGGLLAR